MGSVDRYVQGSSCLFGRCSQALVSRPQCCSLLEEDRRQQVGIRVANAHAENAMSIDHCHDFVMRGDDRFALSRKESQDAAAIPQTAKSQFADDARVT
ncbi:hypothetical protein ACVIKO_005434 [Rhizobium ruizarguesonis]|jgi:hypothetical protein